MIEVFSQNALGRFAKSWSKTLGEEAIAGLAGCPGKAKGRLVSVSRNGFVAALAKDASVEWITYLDSAAVSFAPSKSKSNETEWLAATAGGGLYAIDLKGTIRAFSQLNQPVSAIRVSMPFIDGSFIAASKTSVSAISRLD